MHTQYSAATNIKPPKHIKTDLIELTTDGTLTLAPRFDFSANWPAINTNDAIRAAAEHDAFYWLMKNHHLSRDYREQVDYWFYTRLCDDGMQSFRALYWWKGVRIGGDEALNSEDPPILIAPLQYQPIPRSSHFPYLPTT